MNQSRNVCIKKFTNQAKQFINSENVSNNVLIEGLDNIAALDFCSLSHSKVDVSLLFNSLWELMSCVNSPHWNCVSVLNSAIKDPTYKKILSNTYRFMPILANLLLKPNISLEEKLKLLNLMEELSIGIDISWQEPYLLRLIKELYNWIFNTNEDYISIAIRTSSLSLLVNLCYNNMCVINLMIENVDTKNLMRYLISKESSGSESIQICRLLLSLHCNNRIPSMNDVHNYLGVAMQTLVHGVKKINKQELYYISILLKDLCTDTITKSHVLNYDHFEDKLQEVLKSISRLLIDLNDESKQCLQIILTIFHTLIKLDLYSLRSCHKMIIEICTKTFTISELTSSSYRVLSDIIVQYEEDGMLPDDVASAISVGLRGLLEPLILDVKSAGVSWLSFVCALNDCHATRESILHNVKPEKFEEVIKEILQCDCNDSIKEEAILIACHVSLSFTKREGSWEICLHHLLSNPFTQKILSGCTNNVVQSRRKQLIHIIRHPDFPFNRIDEVFFSKNLSHNKTKESLNCSDSQNSIELKSDSYSKTPFLIQDEKLDSILKRVDDAFEKNELHGIATSHLIELYRYKVLATEHRLNAANTSLQSANHAVTQLNHSMALLENTSRFQEEILLNTQIYNEKLKENVSSLSEQMEGAEKVIKKFQSKLAAEKLDREQCAAKTQREYSQKLKEVEETMMKYRENMQMQLDEANEHKLKMEEQLSEQVNKNNELTNILIKFEEKVKQKEKKLEEVTRNQNDFKNQLIESQETVQKLEKTLLEREQRLTQVTSQLEEMQKVQDMIANLMGQRGGGNTSNNTN